MKKVDFNANTEWLYQQNWRLFQRALVELDISDYVRVIAPLCVHYVWYHPAMESPRNPSPHLQPELWSCKDP